MFFGTPHYGANWAALLSGVTKLRGFFGVSTTAIVDLLSNNSAYLDRLHSQFMQFSDSLLLFYLHEQLTTPVAGIGSIQVGCSYGLL